MKILIRFIALLLCLICKKNLSAQSPQGDVSAQTYQSQVIAAEKKGDKKALADALARLGFEQAVSNNFLAATANAEKAIKLFEELQLPKEKARCYGTLIWIHNTMRNYDKVENYAFKVLSVGMAEKDTFLLFAANDALGNIADSRKEFAKALDFYKQSLQYATIVGDSPSATLLNLSCVYKNLGQWDEALKNATTASQMLLEEGDTLRYTTALYNEALINTHFRRFDVAEKLMQKADALTQYMAIPEADRDMYLIKSLFFEQKGDFLNAYKTHQKYHATDSLLTAAAHHEQFAQFEIAYQTKEKEKENEALAQKIKNQYLTFGIIFLLLAGLAGLFFFQRNRLKIKHQILENEQVFAQNTLNNYVQLLSEKTDALDSLRQRIEQQENSSKKEEIIGQLLNSSILTEEQWSDFRQKFERVHQDFFKNLHEAIPDITEGEKRFAALTKLNLSGVQIASMLGISPDSVVKIRYRFRKKIEGGKLEGVLSNM
jgi:hypothetical protein